MVYPTCSTQGRALKVACADTDSGIALNFLTPAVLPVLHRHVVTFWATPGNIDGRRHLGMRFYGSLSELRALIKLPSELQFIEDWSPARRHGNSSSKAFASIPLQQADYVPVNSLNRFPATIPEHMFFTPESAWQYWQNWAFARVWPPPESCTSRADFAIAFRAVYDELRPNAELHNPPPRSYLAMHLREGDKRRVSSLVAAAVRNAAHKVAKSTGLPWLVISDNTTAAKSRRHSASRAYPFWRSGNHLPNCNQRPANTHGAASFLSALGCAGFLCALGSRWHSASDQSLWRLD